MVSDIILGIVGTALTTLAAWGIAKLTQFIDSKMADKQAAGFLNEALSAVFSATKITYQTYVEAIKGSELWNADAQKKALNMAKETAIAEFSTGAKNYIEKNYGDIEKWVENKIESSIYSLKNGKENIAE